MVIIVKGREEKKQFIFNFNPPAPSTPLPLIHSPPIPPDQRSNYRPSSGPPRHSSGSLPCTRRQTCPWVCPPNKPPTIPCSSSSSAPPAMPLYCHAAPPGSCTATEGEEHFIIKQHQSPTHKIHRPHLVTPTHVVALKDHGRIVKVKLVAEPAVRIVPVLTRDLAALTRVRGATRKEYHSIYKIFSLCVPPTHLSGQLQILIWDILRSTWMPFW